MLLCLRVEFYEASAYRHQTLRCAFHLNPALASNSFLGWVLPTATIQARPSLVVTL